MQQAARSTLLLGSLSVLLVVVAIWGWNAATQPFPGRTEIPKCVPRSLDAGDKVYADQVTVSVFNASGRNGLAERTMQEFTDAGFGEGDTGNAPREAKVRVATIWTRTPGSPAVRLVASRLGPKVKVVRHDPRGVGVTVLVGDGFKDLVKGRRSVKAQQAAEICSPPST